MKYLVVRMLIILAACSNGQDGAQGPQGPSGSPGVNVNPHPVQWVQFCPNVDSNYPSTFPEGGFCIDGNVYAVYSANDGFLTLLPPGTYNSNAVGSSCTFTLLSGCQIQ